MTSTQRSGLARSLAPVFLACMLTACTASPPGDGSTGDYQSLVAALRASGLRIVEAGEIAQPFFTPKAKVVRIGESGEAQVYEYDSEKNAAAEAARVHPDGSVGTSMPMWIAPPHFFRSGRLLVLYLGSDRATLRSLTAVMGPPFAGVSLGVR